MWFAILCMCSRKPNVIWRRNLHQLTSLAKSQKALEAHGCKRWVTNLSIIPHTLGILTAKITCCIILLEYRRISNIGGLLIEAPPKAQHNFFHSNSKRLWGFELFLGGA